MRNVGLVVLTRNTGSTANYLLSGATMLGAFFILTDPVTLLRPIVVVLFSARLRAY